MPRPTGKTDLATLLAEMRPLVRPGEFVMLTTTTHEMPAEAMVVEDEGTTLVIRKSTAEAFRLEHSTVFAWITLSVHSSLMAVGLTAAVSGALAARGIPANVLAGYYHDHLLVPQERLTEALDALRELGTAKPEKRSR